ncbi:MAG TPA: OmpA family protein, partial [Terriglobia bacterium]|nr:OmpA family protein [Terriglobia bacterium]
IFPVRTTDVNFGLQPGGGIDYWLTRRLGVRVGADYRNVNFSSRDYFRFQSGVVFRFGGN